MKDLDEYFKLEGQDDNHSIDKAGNYFINGMCVNPKTTDITEDERGVFVEGEEEIGYNHPPKKERVYFKTLD